MTSTSRLGFFATVLFAAGTLGAASPNNTPDVIGEVIDLSIPRVSSSHAGQLGRVVAPDADLEADADLVWSTSLSFPDADYIAPHFAKFDIPMGAYVVVRSPDGLRTWTYRGLGKNVPNRSEGFWGVHIYGTTAIVELYSTRSVVADSVVIDRFARGFSAEEMARDKSVVHPLSLCSTDDSLWAKCYQTSEPNAYSKARAVARLMINGTGACTGWLVGSQGNAITNQHCITSAADAANTTFEFLAEGATCATSCATWGGCPGTIAASTSTLVKNSVAFDYALVQLPTNLSPTYGYLQLRDSGAVLNERIYIPQHPAAWGKKIAMKDGTANAAINSLSQPPCAGGTSDLGYNADTQGGSSGSPVISYGDNLVVGLHHCGTCPNRAVPIQSVISDLGALLPAGALGGGTPGDTTAPTVSISSPASGATISGATTVSASAADNIGVTKVEFYLDGVLQATDTTSPYSWSWTPTSAQNGAHSLTAKAYDAASNSKLSTAVSVTVSISTTCAPAQLVANSGFESGAVTWTASSGVIDSSTGRPSHAGTWKAWMNGYAAVHTDTLSQNVSIPACATTATLSFWVRIDTAETGTGTYDTLTAAVKNSAGTSTLQTLGTYSNRDASSTYVQKTFNLAAFKGQTVKISFTGVEDSTLQTSFVIDDVTLNSN